MYFRTTAAANTGAAFFNSIRRRLTTSIPTPILTLSNQSQNLDPQNPEAAAEDTKKLVSSVLSSPHFNPQVWKDLLCRLNPYEFDSIFCDIHRNVNHSTSMQFFHFACESFGFQFTLRSYCLLFHLLVLKNVDSAARTILVRLIDRKLPVCLREGADDINREIACAIVDTYLNFEEFKSRNSMVFDILVHTYASVRFQNGLRLDIAFDVFKILADRGLFPSTKTCAFLMSSLVKANQVEKGYEVLEIVSRVFPPNLAMFNSAITALFKLGKVEQAVDIFKKMKGLGASVAPDAYTYTILIDGFCKSGNIDSAFQFKNKMVANGLNPSIVTYGVIINGLMKLGKCEQATGVVDEMLGKGIEPNAYVYNMLIDGYCKTGNMMAASKLKNLMLQQGIPFTVITYNQLIRGYCKLGDMNEAKRLWEEMPSFNLSPDKYLYSTMVGGFSKLGRMDEAYALLGEMRKYRMIPNVICYTGIISGYCKLGQMNEAKRLLLEMVSFKISPSEVTYTVIIRGYCNLGRIAEALEVLSDMRNDGLLADVNCYTALICGYCKLGHMDEARRLLREMVSFDVAPNRITYTVLIRAYCKLGRITEASECLSEMLSKGLYSSEVIPSKGMAPDDSVILASLCK